MPRHGKVRVLVQNGIPLENPRTDFSAPNSVSLEVGSQSVWSAVAKTPRTEWPEREQEAPLRVSRAAQPVPEAEPEEIDPRDVPLRDISAILKWALDHIAFKEQQREILTAVWFEGGDAERVAGIMNQDPEFVSNLVRRAKSELIRSARIREWEDEFRRTRLNPETWPYAVNFPLGTIPVWFVNE